MILLAGLILVTSVLLSWFCIGRLRHYLLAKDIVDTPNERTMHEGRVPRGGGVVIIVMLALVLLGLATSSARPMLFFALFLTVLFWAGLGWWDDKHDLSPKVRLLLQMGFAVLGVSAFGWVDNIQLTADLRLPLAWFGALLSFVGVLWLANLYNFMDGMDGFSAAQAIVASVTFGFWFWSMGDIEIALICLVLVGASYGFLLWNWKPAKIFMGDVGSIALGAFFASLIIIASSRFDIPVISMVMLFGLFVTDASLTMIRRIIKREKFWMPHRQHYYQRLGLAGMRHDKIVILSIVVMLFCSLIATFSLIYRDTILVCFGVLCLFMLGLVIAVSRYERKQRAVKNHSL